MGGGWAELDHLAVLALVAVFERSLRDRLTSIRASVLPAGGSIEQNVLRETMTDIDFWNFERLIDVFTTVDAAVRGEAKQFVDYRNWVAHGHGRSSPPPINAPPQTAYLRLTEFLQQAGIVASP